MNPFTVCAFAVTSLGIIAVVRQFRPELSNLAVAAAGILIFVYVLQGIAPFVQFVKTTAEDAGVEGYFEIMLKALAISLCCKMSADICRDCGEGTLASRVELAGKASIVIISLPVIQQLLSIAKDMLG